MRPLTLGEFRLFQRLVYQESGINLTDGKMALLAGRLAKRVRDLGLRGYGEYFERVISGDREECVRMLDCVSTNETRFFREPAHFELIAQELVPRWQREAVAGRRQRVIRVWSAGCSTGEEPYSVAMVLLSLLPAEEGWDIRVQASDLSSRVLEVARRGLWPIARADQIPTRYLTRYMLRGVGTQKGWLKACDELRSVIRFERVNFNAPTYAVSGPFELILCRNVLIYFDVETKRRVVGRISAYLEGTGTLLIGHAESLHAIKHGLVQVRPTVYTRGLSQEPDLEESLRA